MIDKLEFDAGYYHDPIGGADWESPKDYLQIEILGLCGCGNPDEVMLYIKDKLEKLEKMDSPQYEDLPSMFFQYWANDKGFAEHGSTVRCSWLTDKGKELLKDIKSVNHRSVLIALNL